MTTQERLREAVQARKDAATSTEFIRTLARERALREQIEHPPEPEPADERWTAEEIQGVADEMEIPLPDDLSELIAADQSVEENWIQDMRDEEGGLARRFGRTAGQEDPCRDDPRSGEAEGPGRTTRTPRADADGSLEGRGEAEGQEGGGGLRWRPHRIGVGQDGWVQRHACAVQHEQDEQLGRARGRFAQLHTACGPRLGTRRA